MSKTQPIDPQLSITYRYTDPSFYVRDCYDEYYHYIVDQLENTDNDYITVTGTPGIGMGLFYIYFFLRYRKEFPLETIVTASVSDSHQVIHCKVFGPNKIVGIKQDRTIPQIEGSLHLYDGPGRLLPDGNRLVCFTGPNKEWFKQMIKETMSITLYMPVWSLEELQEANDLLELGIPMDEIERRYSFFGGVARHCLLEYADLINEKERGLQRKIDGTIYSKDLKNLAFADDFECFHVFHYVPVKASDGLPTEYSFRFCSDQVAIKALKNYETQSSKNFTNMFDALDDSFDILDSVKLYFKSQVYQLWS